MAETTVKKLADVVGTPVDKLLTQMKEAGLPHEDAEALVNDDQKQQLLSHLRKSHGSADAEPKKITLKRKTQSTIKTTGSTGKAKTVAVEVRKKPRPDGQRDRPFNLAEVCCGPGTTGRPRSAKPLGT